MKYVCNYNYLDKTNLFYRLMALIPPLAIVNIVLFAHASGQICAVVFSSMFRTLLLCMMFRSLFDRDALYYRPSLIELY